MERREGGYHGRGREGKDCLWFALMGFELACEGDVDRVIVLSGEA